MPKVPKMTRQQVREMEALRQADPKKWTYRALAERYGVSGPGIFKRFYNPRIRCIGELTQAEERKQEQNKRTFEPKKVFSDV